MSNKFSGHNIAFAVDDINDYFLSDSYKIVQSVPLISVYPLFYLSTCCETKFLMSTAKCDKVVSVLTSFDSVKATDYGFWGLMHSQVNFTYFDMVVRRDTFHDLLCL